MAEEEKKHKSSLPPIKYDPGSILEKAMGVYTFDTLAKLDMIELPSPAELGEAAREVGDMFSKIFQPNKKDIEKYDAQNGLFSKAKPLELAYEELPDFAKALRESFETKDHPEIFLDFSMRIDENEQKKVVIVGISTRESSPIKYYKENETPFSSIYRVSITE